MTNKSLRTMKKLFSSIDYVEKLNHGGCLYGAYGVWLAMKKQGILSAELVQITYTNVSYDGSILNNKAFVKGEVDSCESGYHFGLSLNGGKTIYDSAGRILKWRYIDQLVVPNSMTKQFIISSLSYNNWNKTFNREKGVAELNRMLGVDMKLITF